MLLLLYVFFHSRDDEKLGVVGNHFELLVRRRADGAIASFFTATRDYPGSDEENMDGNMIRIEPLCGAPWAYVESVNESVYIPALGQLETRYVAFRELLCVLMVDKDQAQDDATNASPDATWSHICMDLKFDATFLSISQLDVILKQKLSWSHV